MPRGRTPASPLTTCPLPTVGAINEVVAAQIRAGATERLHDLVPTLVYMELALLGVAEEAAETLHRAPALR